LAYRPRNSRDSHITTKEFRGAEKRPGSSKAATAVKSYHTAWRVLIVPRRRPHAEKQTVKLATWEGQWRSARHRPSLFSMTPEMRDSHNLGSFYGPRSLGRRFYFEEQNMQTNAAQAAAKFPSPEFARRIAELRAAIANDREEIGAVEKKLVAMSTNRDAITAVGKNPDEEIRNARAGVKALELRIAAARSEITQLFLDERIALDQLRAETWKTLCTRFVDPMIHKIAAAAQALNAQFREVVALMKSEPAEFSTQLDFFRTSVDEWNKAVANFGNLGIGGNLAMPESDLRANVVDALKRPVRDNFGPMSAISEALALFAVEPWKEAQPTLAERIEEKRKRLQRAGEPYNP
jgi:hypothetical protein